MQLISIIIPIYNHLPELKKALESIKTQTYSNLEVIIVDDGSGENVAEKIKPENFDFSIRFIRQENKGAAAARNRGWELAQGELIIFWDADVVGEPDMLKKMRNVLTIHPEASYVYCDFYYGKREMKAMKFNAEKLKENNYIMTTGLIRREDFPGFDESLKRWQDWDLWLTMLENDKIGIYIPEFLFFVFSNKKGISAWLPSFAYKKPWRWLPGISGKVKEYDATKQIVMEKHGIWD